MHFTGNAGFQGEQLSWGGWVARALWYFGILCFIPKDSPPTILHPVCIVMPAAPPRHTTMPTLLHPNSVLSQMTFDTLSMVFYILYFIFGDSCLSVHCNHSRTRSVSKPEASCHPDNHFPLSGALLQTTFDTLPNGLYLFILFGD